MPRVGSLMAPGASMLLFPVRRRGAPPSHGIRPRAESKIPIDSVEYAPYNRKNPTLRAVRGPRRAAAGEQLPGAPLAGTGFARISSQNYPYPPPWPRSPMLPSNDAQLEAALKPHLAHLQEFIRYRIPKSLKGTVSAEDIVNETVLVVVAHERETFLAIPPEERSAWLKTVAGHILINQKRAAERKKRGGGVKTLREGASARSSQSFWGNAVAAEKGPSKIAALREADGPIAEALATLTENRRLAVTLRLIEGKTLAETAKLMNKSPEAVRDLVREGLRELRKRLGRASRFLSGSTIRRKDKPPPESQA